MALHVHMINDEKGMLDFLGLPHRLYRADGQWVAPIESEVRRTLDADKNPYFEGCDLRKFVCYDGREPVARAISVINPRHWKKFDCKVAFFGFFESENDAGSTAALVEAMSETCRGRGASHLEGPFNPNHYSELGLLVENFCRPAFFETYNPPWYSVLLKDAGFDTVCRLHTRRNADAKSFVEQHPTRSLSSLQTGGYTVRPFNVLRMKADLERIRQVYNDAFADNWHFLPVSAGEYDFSARGLFLVTRPSLIQIVEHNGEPVGVLQCVLNVNPLLKTVNGLMSPAHLLRLVRQRKGLHEVVIYAVGIKRAYQKGRVFRMLHAAMAQVVQRYPAVYSTWMTEDNVAAIKASEVIGLVPYKWFEILRKPL